MPLHLELAKVYDDARNSEKTIEYCARVLRINSENSLAHALMGAAYTRRNQWDKAVSYLLRAIGADPASEYAYELLGRLVLEAVLNLPDDTLRAALSDPVVSVHYGPIVIRTELQPGVEYYKRGCTEIWQYLRVYYRLGMLYCHAEKPEALHDRIRVAAQSGYAPAQEWLAELQIPSEQQPTAGLRHIDLRDDNERQIEADAIAGISLGEEYDLLVKELIEIGRSDDYLSAEPGGKFDDRCRHLRTRQIGNHLNDRGGKDLMCAVYYRIGHALGSEAARRLEIAWGYIGECLP